MDAILVGFSKKQGKRTPNGAHEETGVILSDHFTSLVDRIFAVQNPQKMYDGGSNGGHMNVPRYLEDERDYNHHNSASLEVVEAHHNNLNGNEDEYVPTLAQQQQMMMMSSSNGLSDYSDLHQSSGVVGQENMMTHVFMPNNYGMDPNQYQTHMIPQHLQGHAQEQMLQAYQAQVPHHSLYDQGMIMQQHHQMLPLSMQAQNQQIHQVSSSQAQLGRAPSSAPQQEDHQAPLQPPRKKSKAQYPWLEVQGPACYSERQEAGNVDLSNVSKKYKSMRCLYCTKYNPVTPWATMRPRKYELSSLLDHANSIHHQKAEKAREEALSLPAMVPSVVYQIPEDSPASDPTGELAGAGLPSQAQAPQHSASPATVPQQQQQQQQHPSMQQPPQQQQQVNNNTSSSSSNSNKQNVNTTKKKRNVMELVKTHATRGILRPPWLHTEGGLIFSERQLNDVERPASLVRKYQLMMCTACAQHSPRSPWATLKPRKFEARLLAEHELSTHHQKTLSMTSNSMYTPATAAATASTASSHAQQEPYQHPAPVQHQQHVQGQGQGHGQVPHGQGHAHVQNQGQVPSHSQGHGHGQVQGQQGQGANQQSHLQHSLLQQQQQQAQQQQHLSHSSVAQQASLVSGAMMPLRPLSTGDAMSAASMAAMEDEYQYGMPLSVDHSSALDPYSSQHGVQLGVQHNAGLHAGQHGVQHGALPSVPIQHDHDRMYPSHMVYSNMLPSMEIHEDLSLDPSAMHDLGYDPSDNMYAHQQQYMQVPLQQAPHQSLQQQHNGGSNNSGNNGGYTTDS